MYRLSHINQAAANDMFERLMEEEPAGDKSADEAQKWSSDTKDGSVDQAKGDSADEAEVQCSLTNSFMQWP
ncbi:Uu.00g055820.m01.CDS01 [Anthostomella pinea]|uniref:Uu.00g055820.m01.CDS01 n=1 Tax=Anthostomella pinea TaxID=933095 RepID=A0AAI8VWW4_9PEZI|nr:Uu.00g055820.m01.CDS01 [Anthostomella pinea]